jgi:tetratricopeptide (TPR) repeat protein
MNARRGSGRQPAPNSGPLFASGRQDPRHVEQALARASDLAGRGRAAEAESLCRQVLAVMPRLAAAHFVAGEIAEARKKPDDAIECYRRATLLDPDYFPGWMNLGVCLRERGNHEGAIAAYEQAIRIDPRSAQAYNNLASAQVTTNELGKAIGNFERALKLRPGSAEIRLGLARMYLRIEKLPRAIELVRSALELDEANAEAWAILGTSLQVEGRFGEAEDAFLRALSLDAQHVLAHLGLAMMKRPREIEDRALESIESVLAGRPNGTPGNAGLHFAAAHLHERHGDYDAAFGNYLSGNTLRSELNPYSAEGSKKEFDALIATFTPELLATRPYAGSPSTVPVFIVGMPRSGTTLTEQIIASHPDAAAAGELMTFRDLLEPKSRVDQERNLFVLPNETEAATIIRGYLEMLTEGRTDALRVTDKLPFNFFYLGMIQLLFPHAKIIHCRRDPMDTCLSCFCQNFTEKMNFTMRMEDLGTYYRLYDRLMRHWKAVLPRPILEVDYERLTGEPEAAIREIIDFCELPWNDACLAPHETQRSVRTASIWQVRQPIYRSSVAKWKRFEKHLGPLKQALGDLFADTDAARNAS